MTARILGPQVDALLCGLATLIIVLLGKSDSIDLQIGFVALTMLLLLYLLVQVMRVRRIHPDRWLLNPVVVCSGMTFFMGYGIGNVLYFLPADTIAVLGLIPEINNAMFKFMSLVLVGAMAMWLGYWSRIAAFLSNANFRQRISKLLQKSNVLHSWAVPVMVAVSVGSRLLTIKLGLYGYSSNNDRLIEMGSITQYLTLASSLGKLALVIVSLEYYSNRSNFVKRNLFFIVLFLELIFGLLSGMKTQVVLPFLTIFICQYIQTNRVDGKWIVVAIFAIFVSYQVIEPFRDEKNADSSFSGTSATEIGRVMIDAASRERSSSSGREETNSLLLFLGRSSYVNDGSVGIEYADRTTSLPEGSPEFLENIFLAPFHAWIPRFIWTSKPLSNLGLWYTQVVIGNAYSFSSTAMSPFTFLYFTGGTIAVFMGFFFIGLVQRTIFFLLQPQIYMGGAVVFIGLLSAISVIGDGFNDLIITLVRELPLLLLVQRIIYKS